MRPSGNKTALLLLSGLVCTCVHGPPREPFLWDDDAPLVKAQRVDVLEAEAVVIRFMRAHGAFSAPAGICVTSSRAYELSTSETAEAYQVFVLWNPNLCDAPPGVEVDPPLSLGYEGPAEYAVSKKDLHIISMRFSGDEFKAAWKEESRKQSLAFLDAGFPQAPDAGAETADSSPLSSYPDGGIPQRAWLVKRSELPDTFYNRDLPAGYPFHMAEKKEKPQRDGGVEACPCECQGGGGRAEGSAAPDSRDGGNPEE